MVTNFHVIAGAHRGDCHAAGPQRAQRRNHRLAPEKDLAVLRMVDPPDGLVTLPMGIPAS